MMLASIPHLSLLWLWLWLWLPPTTLAQSDCAKDGATSTYNESGLIVPFDNLCGRDIAAALDFSATPEQRRSDCLARCVRAAPLCYGFDYAPYVGGAQNNCWLMNGTFPAGNATGSSRVADAGMLGPAFLAQLPENCKALGLRGCFERNGGLGVGTAAPTGAEGSSSSASSTVAPSGTPTNSGGEAAGGAGGLSTAAKAGIGAGVGLVALIAVLGGMLIVLKRVKRRRAADESAVAFTASQQGIHGCPQQKAESQVYARVATGSPGLVSSSPVRPASSAGQVHEIDGRARHEK